MSSKSPRLARMIEECQGCGVDPYYLGFFRCFNAQLFFEAHEVLEELWLKDKASPNYAFYKGLIQLAGAFVHLQKNRLKPAEALFGLAEANLRRYPERYERLDVQAQLRLIADWRGLLRETSYEVNPWGMVPSPRIELDGVQ